MHGTVVTRRDRAYRALPAAALAVAVLAAGGAAYGGLHTGGQPTAPDMLHLAGLAGVSGETTMGPAYGTGTHPAGGYQLRGTLPTGPDQARVYQLAPELTDGQLARLIAALGMRGTPASVAGQQVLTNDDATLTVTNVAGHPWNYVRIGPGPKRWFREPDPPDAVNAAATAAPVLAVTGLDASAASVHAGGAVATVEADPVVDGLPSSGYATRVSVDAGGVSSAQGWLGGATGAASYPVISARAAFDQLRTETTPVRYQSFCPLLRDTRPTHAGQADQPPVCPSVPDSAVTGARFGLLQRWTRGGAPMLVPAWLFSVLPAGGETPVTVSQVAVDPAFLTTPDSGAGAGSSAGVGAGSAETEPVAEASPLDLVRVSADGRTLTAMVGGAPAGDAPCQAVYRPVLRQYQDRVVLGVTITPNPRRAGLMCPAIAQIVPVSVQLDQPLGGRVLDDAATGKNVADVRHD